MGGEGLVAGGWWASRWSGEDADDTEKPEPFMSGAARPVPRRDPPAAAPRCSCLLLFLLSVAVPFLLFFVVYVPLASGKVQRALRKVVFGVDTVLILGAQVNYRWMKWRRGLNTILLNT